MKTIATLTKETFKTVIDNFGFLLALQLLGALLPIAVLVLWGLVFGFSESVLADSMPRYVAITLGVFFVLLILCANSVYTAMGLYAAHDSYEKKKKKKYGEYYKKGFDLMFKIVTVSVIGIILTIIGLFLLVIPGLLIAYYLMFSIVVAVFEKKGIFESLSRSARLVSQNFWPLLWRVLLFGVGYMLVILVTNFIPFVNIAVSIFASMIATMFMYILYHELTKSEEKSTSK